MMSRNIAMLMLLDMLGDTARQLQAYEAAPYLAAQSPNTIQRLTHLSEALGVAIADMQVALEAELAK